ncbi:MAG TPA: ABC transporter ATP-binding protein [Dehalococcoidia bacterium]|nr:ABC transporter ATP-binding protein [Dehalococcoidia bacterium]
MTPLLEVSQIVAGYGETEILHGISMQVFKGEFVTIIGPNGSGKSTLLKSVYGLVRPQRGAVWFQGRNITEVPPERMVEQGLSYVPQSSNIFPSLSVQENLEMGAYIRKGGLRQRLQEMYALFPDLAQRRSQKAGNLSGGQRQMLAFARAMMLDPRLLLLDEPSAGLSPAMVGIVFDAIKRIHGSGVSIVIVEQNARDALRLSHRGYVLANGENRLEGEGEELLNSPEVARLYLGG